MKKIKMSENVGHKVIIASSITRVGCWLYLLLFYVIHDFICLKNHDNPFSAFWDFVNDQYIDELIIFLVVTLLVVASILSILYISTIKNAKLRKLIWVNNIVSFSYLAIYLVYYPIILSIYSTENLAIYYHKWLVVGNLIIDAYRACSIILAFATILVIKHVYYKN